MPIIDIRQHGGKFGGGGYSIGSKIPSKRITEVQIEKITSFSIPSSNLLIIGIYFFIGYFYVIARNSSTYKDTIFKYDKKGNLIWSYNHSTRISSQLYYYNGYLYFGSDLSTIVCKLNEVDGSIVSYNAPSNIYNFYGYNGYFVVVCSNSTIVLLNSNLSVLNTISTIQAPDNNPLIAYGNSFYISEQGWQYIEKFQIDTTNKKLVRGWNNSSSSKLFCELLAVNNSYLWVFNYSPMNLQVYSAASGGVMYETGNYSYGSDQFSQSTTVLPGNDYIYAIYGNTIKKISFNCVESYTWDFRSNYPRRLLADNGYLYVSSNDKKLYKYRLTDNGLVWSFNYGANFGATVLAIDDDGVVWLRDNDNISNTDKIHQVWDYYTVLR